MAELLKKPPTKSRAVHHPLNHIHHIPAMHVSDPILHLIVFTIIKTENMILGEPQALWPVNISDQRPLHMASMTKTMITGPRPITRSILMGIIIGIRALATSLIQLGKLLARSRKPMSRAILTIPGLRLTGVQVMIEDATRYTEKIG